MVIERNACLGIKDRGVIVAIQIGRNEIVLGIGEDACCQISFRYVNMTALVAYL